MTKAFASDLKSNTRTAMIGLLNKRLANALDLRLAIEQAHRNIKGPGFIAIHELFDQVAPRAEDQGDTLAKRIVQFGGIAAGTAQTEYVKAVSERLGAFATA